MKVKLYGGSSAGHEITVSDPPPPLIMLHERTFVPRTSYEIGAPDFDAPIPDLECYERRMVEGQLAYVCDQSAAVKRAQQARPPGST